MARSVRLTALVGLLVLLLTGRTATASCVPAIVFDHTPPPRSFENLTGHVTCAAATEYKVAVYIHVSGWWTKPTFDQPLTPINADGSWVADITTGGSDEMAADIAAFLVPNGYTPPQMAGGAVLPEELYTHAAAYTYATHRAVSTVPFSGYNWDIKYAPVKVGPGPNYYALSPLVDYNGYLHLRIRQSDGAWYCGEVMQTIPARYGTHTIEIASPVDALDKNAVLGFFTWDDTAPQYHYREIDIEFSRWGAEAGPNMQYVVQPWDIAGNRYQFPITLSGAGSKHQFTWLPDSVQFDSWDAGGTHLQRWTYTNRANIPPEGGNIRLNLWLLNGTPPSDGQDIEVVIKSYRYTPPYSFYLPAVLRAGK